MRENPDVVALLHCALGHYNAGALAQAVRVLAVVIAVTPEDPNAVGLRGGIAARSGDDDGAVVWSRRALRLTPDRPQAIHNLVLALIAANQTEAAYGAAYAMVALRPGDREGWRVLAGLARRRDNIVRLESALARFLAIAPGDRDLHAQLADIHWNRCHFEHALAQFSIVEDLAPDPVCGARKLLTLNMLETGPDTMLAAARRWAARYAEPLATATPHLPSDPERRLRIGYLGAPLGTLLRTFLPILQHHDPDRVETFVYDDSLSATRPMGRGAYWGAAAHYRAVGGLDDGALADLIRRDHIDILVDGLGFPTAQSRLLTLARRPAPLQIHFPPMQTTGMSAVDYLMADPVLVPEGSEGWYVERIFRLPRGFHYTFTPPILSEIALAPVLGNGHITFGSFNQAVKLGPKVLTAWSRILDRVPSARLKIKAIDMTPAIESDIRKSIADVGGDASRVAVIEATATYREHLACFDTIDVHLDSFPYNGVTTTSEALWKGVPVVTLAGERILDRYSASMLHEIGLDACIAADVDGYVDAACRLVADTERLAALRSGLRQRVERSRLMDSATFTRDLEEGYRQIWRRACDRSPSTT